MSLEAKKSVLIVDDEPELTAFLRDTFADMDFEIDTAIDAREAEANMDARTPDLVCLNLSLPRGSGYDLCDRIRTTPALAAVKILVMSDRALPEDIAFAEEAGADAFLRRPHSLHALRERINAAVAQLFDPRYHSVRGVRRLYHVPAAGEE